MNLLQKKSPPIPYSTAAQNIKVGALYEHYKGKNYKIIALARHTETLEEIIVYQALYDDNNFWVRPLEMFCENIELEGHIVPRFKLISPPE